MELYLDTADIQYITRYADLSIFKGVTTTPTFFYRQGIQDIDGELKKILGFINGYVHAEAIGNSCGEIVGNAQKNARLGKGVVSKIPVSFEGIKALRQLKKENIKVNVHLVFSVSQALLAAEAGADYICPLIGRLNDIEGNGIALIENIVKVVKQYNYPSKIMASSIRSQEDITYSLLSGVDAITIPPSIVEQMFRHPLTRIAINIFQKDILLAGSVEAIMRTAESTPILDENCVLLNALTLMTEKKIGLCIAVDADKKISGVITDGDIRRVLEVSSENINSHVATIMNRNPFIVTPEISASKALELMEENRITALVVADCNHHPIGYLNLHDILEVMRDSR